jgi:glycosyltransferase Alg8
MWTMLFSPMLAIAGGIKMGGSYVVAYFIYIAITRALLSIVLFTYARRVDLNYIWCLYANQILNAAVKIYMMWRLAKQKWSNRGNQKQGFAGDGAVEAFRGAMAVYLTLLSASGLLLAVMVYTELVTVPSAEFVWTMFLS